MANKKEKTFKRGRSRFEAQTTRPPREVAAARRAWRALSAEHQNALIDEVIETRRDELCRAFKNVVALLNGHRRKRTGVGVVRVRPTPVVVLVVKKKLEKDKVKPADRLPDHLLAYWTVNRKRVLCAVPTDVTCGSDYTRFSPESKGIVVGSEATGVITCAVRPPAGYSNQRFAMSCRHVFGMTRTHGTGGPVGITVKCQGDGVVGRTERKWGQLKPGQPSMNLDAALARVTELSGLTNALKHLSISTTWVKSLSLIKGLSHYYIRTPTGAIKARFAAVHTTASTPLGIYYDRVGLIHHPLLIESHVFGDPTEEGDSGSPVLAGKNGGLLLGMHIAGNGVNSALMIPAWFLKPAKVYFKTALPKKFETMNLRIIRTL